MSKVHAAMPTNKMKVEAWQLSTSANAPCKTLDFGIFEQKSTSLI
jgi:hypothetical protein